MLCPDCGKPKILFESESKANNFIKFNASEIPNGDKLRSYYCPACCGWHVSSHEYDGINRTARLLYAYHKYKNNFKSKRTSKHSTEEIQIMHDIANLLRNKNISTRRELKLYLNKLRDQVGIRSLKGQWCKLVNICCEDLGITQ